MLKTEKRNPERFKLRGYMDALKQAESTTDEEWVENWVRYSTPESTWVPRATWIATLKEWIVAEVSKELSKEAA